MSAAIVRREQLDVLVALPAIDLVPLVLAIQRRRIKQVSAVFRQDDAAILVAKVDGFHEPLVAEVLEGVVVDCEVLFGHDMESADSGECSAICEA